jgi:hypothetical protein
MRKLLKRWYVWLGLLLVLGLAASVALICSGRGRITQANFDRIQEGMSVGEIRDMLGAPDFHFWDWNDGPNSISVSFDDQGLVKGKRIHLATTWETLKWHAKKGAAKIGVNWD